MIPPRSFLYLKYLYVKYLAFIEENANVEVRNELQVWTHSFQLPVLLFARWTGVFCRAIGLVLIGCAYVNADPHELHLM